jgi:hypothetical protein
MAANDRKINYFARNFLDVRTELINFIKKYYPELLSDFNDASVGNMLLELNAAVADMLSHHTDRMFQETQLDFAKQRRSVLNIARTLGLKVPGKAPSITLVDFSVTVPTRGDTFDNRYAPVIKVGAQASGGGQIYETTDEIDFNSPFSAGGIANRLILPNTDANGNLTSYTLVKREFVLNGASKIFKKTITAQDNRPFLEITLPDTNVLSVEQMIALEGTSISRTPTIDQFTDPDNRWYEVDSLAEDKIFIKNENLTSDNSGVQPGKWVKNDRRFVKEYTDKGFCKITFGSGNAEADLLSQFGENPFTITMGDFINSNALGEIPKPNTTMFVRYRVGGGPQGNVGANVITSVGNFEMTLNGPNGTINQNVRRSLTVNNPIPAFGGANEPSTEKIKQMVRYNFASQNRAVTLKDYSVLMDKMPGKFGVPFRSNVSEKQNKVEISILGLNSEGKLTNASINTLKENLAAWLSDYRMINDYVLVRDGKIFDLGFEVDVLKDKDFSGGAIVGGVISKITEYFDVNKWEMGESIYISQLIEQINNVAGVLNVTDIRVYNINGGKYSLNTSPQELIDDDTSFNGSSARRINLTEDFALFAEYDSMFQIRFPDKDIRVRVK